MSTVLRSPVAKKNTDRTEEGKKQFGQPEKTTTKVSRDLLTRAKAVANHRGLDLFDYLDRLLRPLVEKDYREYIRTEATEP